MNVKEHYENHLGNFYSWMIGDFDARCKEQEEYFARNCVFPRANKQALDLGAGNGIQSVALASLGFEVKAIDFSSQLTSELKEHAKSRNIDVITCDFTDEKNLSAYAPETIVCMGDTITHLESVDILSQLVKNIYDISAEMALFVISYRDLSKELTDEQRFIPVKADSSRILTCFLEYFPEYVKVTDLLYELENGCWIQKVSSYKKLRLNIDLVRNIFTKNNFSLINMELNRGMNYLIFQKR